MAKPQHDDHVKRRLAALSRVAITRIVQLMAEIAEKLGDERTRQLVYLVLEGPTDDQVKEAEDWSLLHWYDLMQNADRLARRRHAEDATVTIGAHEKRIERARKDRKKKMKAGTWRGPQPPRDEG